MSEKKQQNRQFLVILTIVFLGFIGISMPYLIFPPLFVNPEYLFLPVGWSDASRALFLGITLAAYPIGQFFGSPILGALSDDYGRKSLLSGSLLIAAICNLLTGIAIGGENLALLIVSRLLAGFMEGNIAIARAMVVDLKLLSKHDTLGKINAVASIAYLVGPLLGGAMADKNIFEWFSTSTPFFFTCILFSCLAGLALLILKKSAIQSSAAMQTVWQRMNFIKRIRKLFGNKKLKFLMIVSTCFTLAVDIYYEFGPVYLTLKWALGPSELILYNGVLCAGLAIGNGWLPTFVSSRIPQAYSILATIGGFGCLLVSMTVVDSMFWMLLLFTLSGLVIGLAVTLLTVKISDSVADSVQGEVMGTQLSLRVLGDGVICLIGGALLIVSPKLILLVAAVLSFTAMVYYTQRDSKLGRQDA
ncbi:MAG TPA: MFS transporter [Chlamydiales bacterium]|jgi:MFS family permease|nr:MFS transporter [Chlamydiales bacterium]